MSRPKPTTRRGFSLMELLAVVTILGIIAAIVVPRVSTSTDTARQSVNNHNIATINSAVERFFIEVGRFPTSITEISTDVNYFPDGLPPVPTNPAASYALDGDNRAFVSVPTP